VEILHLDQPHLLVAAVVESMVPAMDRSRMVDLVVVEEELVVRLLEQEVLDLLLLDKEILVVPQVVRTIMAAVAAVVPALLVQMEHQLLLALVVMV
jgi:hypothetical protein